jgi:hypothetical protein
MDMKKILQAFDGASAKKPVEGSDSMKKFLSIVSETPKNNNKVEDNIGENGLQYYTGKKKYGKDGMAALAKAGREGASEEELGRIKDKYKKEDINIDKNLSFKDYLSLAEAKKKITASEDPCWKGYKMVGTKKKGGREVPNCVPGKKGD